MLRQYVEQLLNIYNYIDGIMVTDERGYVEFYKNYRPNLNNLKESDVLHRHVTDVYPSLTEETSSIMRVLKSGKSISNEFQTLDSYKGQSINAINTTFPIKENGRIVGAVDVSRYLDTPYRREDIVLSARDNSYHGSLYTLEDIITCSRSMEIIKERIPMIADTDSSVLIYGETGTGKEMVAQAIHTSSKRRNKKFISQNCAAIPPNLLESMLFGTVKGSYTGAENKPGLFEAANGGTLFLDEINSMEVGIQSKLLKAIEEKQITRLGGYEPVKIDVKIISAFNEEPFKCVEEGRIRSDLFYRLSVVQLNIPPLRERKDDLLYLANYFIGAYNRSMGREIIGLSQEAEAIFRNYDWPGNIRELKNVIEGAFNIASSNCIQAEELPAYLTRRERLFPAEAMSEGIFAGGGTALTGGFGAGADGSRPKPLDEAVEEYEKSLITAAVETAPSLVEAARLLGITKQNLNYKMKKFKIKRR